MLQNFNFFFHFIFPVLNQTHLYVFVFMKVELCNSTIIDFVLHYTVELRCYYYVFMKVELCNSTYVQSLIISSSKML